MILRCPACNEKVRLADEFAGKKVRCPQCQEVFTANAPEDAEHADGVQVEAPRRRRRPDSEKRDYDDADDLASERRGSMPGSVIVAVIAMCVMLVMELSLSLLVLLLGNLPPDRLGGIFARMFISGVLGGLVLWGLIVGHRLAWQWGRVLGLLGAILTLLVGIVALTAGPPQNNSLAQFIIAGVSLFVSACLFTIVFALGSRSAKVYFALRCPGCGKDRK